MPRYKYITSSQINKMLKKGRGIGEGKSYYPWTTIRDVPSKGFLHRIRGWKTNRVHHLFSNIELGFFLKLEWASNVIDIRERFPLLPINTTLEIADEMEINHPYDRSVNEPIVFTTDFLVTILTKNNELKQIAYNVVPYSRSESKRILEKAVIEKIYWKRKGVEYFIITEKDTPKSFVSNMKWIHQSRELTFAPGVLIDDVIRAEEFMFYRLMEKNTSLSKVCSEVDELLEFHPGVSLWIVQHLIANRYWLIDITKQLDTTQPLYFKRNLRGLLSKNNARDAYGTFD